jgi:hypothetical protein
MPASEAKHRPFEAGRGILDNRKTATAVLAFCLYASVTSWRSAIRGIRISHHDFYYFGHHFSHDPIHILGLVISIFFLGNIIYKSPLRADRFIFGAAALSLSLSAVAQFAVLSTATLWAVHTAHAFAWTIAAAICLSILVGWTKRDEQPINSD